MVSTDPAAIGGDVAKALDAAEASLRGGTRRDVERRGGCHRKPLARHRPPRVAASDNDAYAWCDAGLVPRDRGRDGRFGGGGVIFVFFFVGKKRRERVYDGRRPLRDVRDGVAWGRAAGFASSTSLWPKAASERRHAVASFGAAGGARDEERRRVF